MAKAATYSERLFQVTAIGSLEQAEAVRAIVQPAAEIGVNWDPAAAEEIASRADGYPFFVQVWASHVWNRARHDPISPADVEAAARAVETDLDTSFYGVRLARLPAGEIRYAAALASLGSEPASSGEVAEAMGLPTSAASPFRSRLIADGLLYSPSYGKVSLAIPGFGDYLRRTID